MSDTTVEETEHAHRDVAGHDAHPSDKHYILIALWLALLTALETSTYYIDGLDENTPLLLAILLPMMLIKFGMVAWFFMHLKNDSRLFTQVFVSGLLLAATVYIVMLLTFRVFF
jgi:cytochrome c oxidase subunit IV